MYMYSTCNTMLCGPNILFSLQASLIGHMDKLNLLKPSTIFMEFGAGRGKGVKCCKLVFGLICKIRTL